MYLWFFSVNNFLYKIDKSSTVAEMCDRLATIDMGRKEGGLLQGLIKVYKKASIR